MHPRVTAILVAQSGAEDLDKTLRAVSLQTRAPDAVIVVEIDSPTEITELIARFGPGHVVSARAGTTFGGAVSHAVHVAAPPESEEEWLWLLREDNAPDEHALERLLGAVEIAPSVAVAGPKLMRSSEPHLIDSFGETISTLGTRVELVHGELDQGQHDRRDDVLGIAGGGMLVRRTLWARLGGFDPGLPSIDAALDFCIRARLAGHRVILVPRARVLSAGRAETFGTRAPSTARLFRITRSAELHRRMVYAPALATIVHWLSFLPLAVFRSLGHLLSKHPGLVPAEFSAAFRALVDGSVLPARRNLRRTRTVGWAAIAGLRMRLGELRERRAQAREAALIDDVGGIPAPRASFLGDGGMWAVLAMAVVGLIAFAPLLGARVLRGGGLLPLSADLGDLWGNVGYGWRELGTGFLGAADPFAAVLAVLGSITFWAPSYSILLLYLAALPLAALGAWCCARRLTTTRWLPLLAALLWAVAPPLLSSLATGHLGAAIAHLALPWLALAVIGSGRSLAAAAAASILLAVVGASAPVLIPALLLLWLGALVARPRALLRTIGIPIPLLALFAPLIVTQFVRGTPLAVFADPGVPVPGDAASGWRLALGDADGGLLGWPQLLTALGVPDSIAPFVIAGLLAPLAVLALLSLFLRGTYRAIPATLTALLGYLTAVAASLLALASVGGQPVTVWAGSGLSLFWLGLIGAALVALDALGRAATSSALLTGITAVTVAVPLLGAILIGAAAVAPSSRPIVPALVNALADQQPDVGTLVLSPRPDDQIAAGLQRGAGATLDDQSTLATTAARASAEQQRIAELAGNLVSRSGFDSVAELAELGIGFIVLTNGDTDTQRRASDALNANDALTAAGGTVDGNLWRFDGDLAAQPEHPGNTDTAIGRGILIGQGVVFGIAVLLALPFGTRRKVYSGRGPAGPADTFESGEE